MSFIIKSASNQDLVTLKTGVMVTGINYNSHFNIIIMKKITVLQYFLSNKCRFGEQKRLLSKTFTNSKYLNDMLLEIANQFL